MARYTWAIRTRGGVVVVAESEQEARFLHSSPVWAPVDLVVRDRFDGPWRLVREAADKAGT